MHLAGRVNLSYVLPLPWLYPLSFRLSEGARLLRVGECWASNEEARCHATEDVVPASGGDSVTRGFDLLRRLGRVDLQIHYPELGVVDECMMI